MKRLALIAVAALMAAGPALATDPVMGLWRTKPDDNGNFGYVRMAPCGAKICGVLVRSFDKAGKPMKSANIGRRIVWDMVDRGNGHYGGGKIWAPDRNKTYASKMKLSGNRLAVSGCILGGLICRSGGSWARVK